MGDVHVIIIIIIYNKNRRIYMLYICTKIYGGIIEIDVRIPNGRRRGKKISFFFFKEGIILVFFFYSIVKIT